MWCNPSGCPAAVALEQSAKPRRAPDFREWHDLVHDTAVGVIAASHGAREAIIELRTNKPDPWNATVLCDVESCKGHEFEVVFVMGVQEGVFPRAGVSKDDFPREAARLYVAMTRAKRHLYLTHSTSDGNKPSPFLWLARSRCDESRYRNRRLESYDEGHLKESADGDRKKWEGWCARFEQIQKREPLRVEQPSSPAPPPQPTLPTIDEQVAAPSANESSSVPIASEQAESPARSYQLLQEAILAQVQRGETTPAEASVLLDQIKRERYGLYCKVSEKGGLSVYGLQRMPVTLYADQWDRLLNFEAELRRFIEVNRSSLKRKGRP